MPINQKLSSTMSDRKGSRHSSSTSLYKETTPFNTRDKRVVMKDYDKAKLLKRIKDKISNGWRVATPVQFIETDTVLYEKGIPRLSNRKMLTKRPCNRSTFIEPYYAVSMELVGKGK